MLDWFHAAERVSDLVKLAFHEDSNPERSKVTKSLKDALWDGLLDDCERDLVADSTSGLTRGSV